MTTDLPVLMLTARTQETDRDDAWSAGIDLEVVDHGFGIPPEDLERVFDRFYRVEATARRRPGTGVGLAIVKQLVEAMGGRVRADSVLGQGSTFAVRLPSRGS